jgi:hypothetical protein
MVDFKLISLKKGKKVTLSQYRPGEDLRAPGG